MSYRDIRFDIENDIATITLNRPDQSNAFSGTMGTELGHAYQRCDRDDAVRAVIVTGAVALTSTTVELSSARSSPSLGVNPS